MDQKDPKPRLLLVGGLAESLINFRGALISDLISRGVEVHVAATDVLDNSEILKALIQIGAKPHDIPFDRAGMNPLVDFRALFALFILINRLKPKYFLAYTIKPVIYGAIAASFIRGVNCYALITGLGYVFQNGGTRRQKLVGTFACMLYKFALRNVKKIIFQNKDDEALFRQLKLINVSLPSVIVNGSGVDLNHFSKLPLISGTMSFMLAARLLGSKGVREYIQAARRIRQLYPTVSFLLAGSLDANPDSICQVELEEWVDSGDIEYLGYISDIRAPIKNCSVYVLPSYREGTPRSVLEAMSMGRPIITTDAPGCRETVIDGDNGFLIPVKNVSALVEAMKKFIDDPALISRMGARSRQIAEDKYDVHKVNALMLKAMGIE